MSRDSHREVMAEVMARRMAGLLAGLIDDAAIFPPGNAPLALALRAHGQYADTRYQESLGPLLVRSSLVGPLRELADPESVVRLGLVADAGLSGAISARDSLQDDRWFELVQVEIPLPEEGTLGQATEQLISELPFTVPTYIEVPQGVDPEPAIAAIGADGAERAKFRCGPADVPTPAELARFIANCVHHGVSFKLTAGLHHALPSVNTGNTGNTGNGDNGVWQHGFLNTLAATWLAIDGSAIAEITAILDSAELEPVTSVLADADVVQLRSRYMSFGSCEIREPIDELYELGLLIEGGQ